MQSINMPQSAMLAGMQQGMSYSQPPGGVMQQGFRGGGLASLRRGYMGGGSIGGGIIHGTPMGSRTGYWNPIKAAKKAVKKVFKPVKKLAQKLVPKELAPAMTWAAPFMGPIAGPLMGGLGSLKMHGKLDPRIMLSATLPHMRFGMPTSMGGSGMGYGEWGGGNSIRRLLTGKGVGESKGILNKFGNMGTKLDEKLFGSKGMWTGGGHPTEQIWKPGKKGLFMDLQGGALDKGSGGIGEIFETLTESRGGGLMGKAEVIGAVLTASSSYAEALEMANQAGVGDAMPGTEQEYLAWKQKIDEGTENFWEGTQAENFRTGGRVGYAMGMGPAGGMMGGTRGAPRAPFEMIEEEDVVEMPNPGMDPDVIDMPRMPREGLGSLSPDYMEAESEGIYDEGEGGDWFNEMFLERTGGGGQDYMIPDEAKERDLTEIMTIGPNDELKAKKIEAKRMDFTGKFNNKLQKLLDEGLDDGEGSPKYKRFKKIQKLHTELAYDLMKGTNESGLNPKGYIDMAPWDTASNVIMKRFDMKKGGRVGYAMGSSQFPPQKRTGLKWGSDQGEGLGGQEVEADMRYEGGFMPYGEEPKADDVPARLSKDEFVFTDEAVAGAGDGDVEVGAERLYNVMKNLEQGGRLSEESEGEMGQGIGAIV